MTIHDSDSEQVKVKVAILFRCVHTPKKTRNPEKDQKKTEKDFIFNRILYYMILYPIWYYCICLGMYPAYFDGKIHEINRNLAGLLLIVALSIDLAGVLNAVTVGRIKCYM